VPAAADRPMTARRVQRFSAHLAAGPGDRAVIAIPFDPDQVWGAKADHPVTGRRVRGG